MRQERAILLRIEELKAQGGATDGLDILLHWMPSAQANLIRCDRGCQLNEARHRFL